MICKQLYIEQIIQIILYTAKYIHVRFNYDVSFERGGHPQKITVCGGGGGHVKKWGLSGGGHGNS